MRLNHHPCCCPTTTRPTPESNPAVAPGASGQPAPLDQFESLALAGSLAAALGGSRSAGTAAPSLQSFAKAPIVGGERDWPAFSKAVDARLTGSLARRREVHASGRNPWADASGREEKAAVGWAMQQNENVRYDVDRKMFFVTDSCGCSRDVASLDDVQNVIRQNGGANQNNGQAFQAVGAFLAGKVKSISDGAGSHTLEPSLSSATAAPADPGQSAETASLTSLLQSLRDRLQRLLGTGSQIGA